MSLQLLTLFSSLLLHESKTINDDNDSVTPVILIPGICGSQIDGWYKKESSPHYYCSKDSKGWTSLWLCLECMVPLAINCWIDNMKLNISDVRNLRNRDGVQTKVNDFGYVEGIGYLDKHKFVVQFEKLIIGLENLAGYKRGVSIRGAPYDFRFTPNTELGQEFMIKLKFLIEETYEINNKNRVLLVAHSMGNPYLVNLLKDMEQGWKDKYIEGYVALAGVFGGAAKAVRALVTGETEGLPESIVSTNKMREFERAGATVYWLMPPASLWGDTPLLFANGRNYTAKDYPALFNDSNIPKGQEMYEYASEAVLFDSDIGVDVYCIHGVGTETPYQFRYNEASFPDKIPTTVNSDGDGTVNIQSLELCKKFKRVKEYRTIDGFLSTHLEILQRVDVIKYIAELVSAKNLARRRQKLDF